METNQKQQLAKEWYNDTSTTKEEKSLLEKFFPELRDSEDEKIRKEMLHVIKQLDENTSICGRKYDYPKWIAWLEKQGNDSIVTDILTKAGLKTYKDGNKWCILVGDNIQDGICGFGDTVDEALLEFLNELLEKQGSFSKINEKLRQYREYLVKETERWHKNEENETLSKIGKQDCIGHANAYISARSEFEDLFNYDSWLEKQGEKHAEPVTVVERDGVKWVRVCACGEDFIVAARDYQEGDKTEFTWEEACEIGTFSKKQGYIMLALKDEINARLEEIGGEPLASYYWSSSEYGQYDAWIVGFGSGNVDGYVKYGSYVARAVAAF